MTSSKDNNSDNDKNPTRVEDLADINDPAELFRRAVGEVTPVGDDKVTPTPANVKAKPRQFEKDERTVMYDAMHDDRDPDELDSGEH